MNNFKKVVDLDVGTFKTVPADLKTLSDIVDNEVVKNTKFNTLKKKESNLEKKIPGAATLTHINQYNTYNKIEDIDKKYQIKEVKWLQLFWI